jgi:uncharacterized hydrophobic protein (TIGR00271 family)
MSPDPRAWFASHLGVGIDRKAQIYRELSKSAALGDLVYWLQLLFGSGIATLGLVLDSPAVIIGAMLISPLMGPILAAGLALAAGDVLLGIRAVVNLTLSCLVAIGFSAILTGVLPFKEVTDEIVARIRPSTLDLGVALLSGAIGSIAICRPTQGIVTSVPGVAIAVALMPPLCVTGFGVGVAVSTENSEGWRIAAGGGLLFLTNLFAIAMTSMLVFLSLHIDLEVVLERVRDWRDHDREMAFFRNTLKRLPVSQGVRRIGSLPGRTLLISVALLMVVFPLSRSMSDIREEIAARKADNAIRQVAIDCWNADLSQFPDGSPRSYIGQVVARERSERVSLQLRVFTNQPCTDAERRAFVHDVASRLRKPDDLIDLALIEIPTASNGRHSLEMVQAPPEDLAVTTAEQLRDRLVYSIDSEISRVRLPGGFHLLDWHLSTGRSDSLDIEVVYFANRDLGADARSLIAADIRERIQSAGATILFRRIDPHETILRFKPGNTGVRPANALDEIGRILADEPLLTLEVRDPRPRGHDASISAHRTNIIARLLHQRWNIDSTRVALADSASASGVTSVRLRLSSPDSLSSDSIVDRYAEPAE